MKTTQETTTTTKKHKLTPTQLEHAFARMDTIYRAANQQLLAKRPEEVVNWNNAASVEEFVKEAELPPMTWAIYGRHCWLGSIDYGLQEKVGAAMRAIFKKRSEKGGQEDRAAALNKVYVQSQDAIIFGTLKPEDMPKFLTDFEEKVAAATK